MTRARVRPVLARRKAETRGPEKQPDGYRSAIGSRTRWLRSESAECICCEGGHVYARLLDLPGGTTADRWLQDVLRGAPEGATLLLSAEVIP